MNHSLDHSPIQCETHLVKVESRGVSNFSDLDLLAFRLGRGFDSLYSFHLLNWNLWVLRILLIGFRGDSEN